MTGTSYGIIAPLTNGITSIIDEADFDAERWYGILQSESNDLVFRADSDKNVDESGGRNRANMISGRLRFLASVGEPLNPEAVVWSKETYGLPFHDNWWQTETGGIMIANFSSMDIRPGSMGRPLPGIDAAIVRQKDDGSVEEISSRTCRANWHSAPAGHRCFADIGTNPSATRNVLSGGFYLTGDLARRDRDGYFWFIGRKDDVIKTSGHLIGPFEVESILMEHKAVAESGVIGKPDPVALEIVKAFVVLRKGHEPSEELRRELLAFARTRLGAAVAPKEIEFVASVPRTRSGKIMRRLLKARELGLPEGDISTLEAN